MASVEIVEVGPRDGYQGIGPFIPTETKIDFLRRLVDAGLRRIEIGSFVSPKALPQMRDTPAILAAVAGIPGLKAQILVPSEKWGRQAVDAGGKALVFVLSVSEAHNRNNASAAIRWSPLRSTAGCWRRSHETYSCALTSRHRSIARSKAVSRRTR